MLSGLWSNLKFKTNDKLEDCFKITQDELKQIQGRNRQFYKVQLEKQWLDKFQPDKEVKKEVQLRKFLKAEMDKGMSYDEARNAYKEKGNALPKQ